MLNSALKDRFQNDVERKDVNGEGMMQKRSLTKDVTRGALRLGLTLVFLTAFLSATGCSSGQSQDKAMARQTGKAMASVSPNPVDYKRKVKVTISGSGFKPKQQLGLLVDMGGAPSDISGLVKPKPVANEKGEFSTVWVIDGEIRRKLLTPTSHTIEVIDDEWRTLAKTTLIFKKPEAKEKKK
jgi:hypothetical protein